MWYGVFLVGALVTFVLVCLIIAYNTGQDENDGRW